MRCLAEQAVEAYQPQGYLRLEAWARLFAAELARDDRDSEALARHGRAAAELFTCLGCRIGMSRAVALPGLFESADSRLREALRIRKRLGDRRGENLSLANFGLLCAAAGDLREGRRCARLGLDRSEAVDDGPGVAGALLDLAVVELFAGERHAARVAAMAV